VNYLGVDVHRAFCQTTVVDEQGAIVERAKVLTDHGHLTEFFRRYSGSRAVIESNTIWEFVYEELSALGVEVTLCNPAQVRAIAQARVKTDKVDADTLAQLLRGGLIPEAWVGPLELRELRKDVRVRRGMREIATTLKNRVYSELIRRGIPYEEGVLASGVGRRWVRSQLSDRRPGALLDALDSIDGEIKSLNKEILLPKFEENASAQLLATVPGVGFYTALTVAAIVGEVHRFRDSSALVSYAGLAPRIRQSATTTRLGPITKVGPSQLRWVLVEAVGMHRRHCEAKATCRLCRFYTRVSRRRGQKKATVATAAKLLRIMYWMLTMNQPYRPQGLDPVSRAEGEPRELD
jgi:transposase